MYSLNASVDRVNIDRRPIRVGGICDDFVSLEHVAINRLRVIGRLFAVRLLINLILGRHLSLSGLLIGRSRGLLILLFFLSTLRLFVGV